MANPTPSGKAGLWIKVFASFFKKKCLFFFEKKNQKTFIYLVSCLSAPVLASNQSRSNAISGRSALASGATM